MDFFIIILRTLLIYIVVFLVMRIMGKREVGKLSVFDLVISIMIAETAVFILEDIKKPILEGLIPMLTLVVVQIFIAYISLKSRKLRLLIDGEPSILIENGRINRDEMRKQKYNLDDLLLQIRQSKVKSLADVEFAILETTGKLTVMAKSDGYSAEADADQESRRGESTKIRFEGLPILLIMDGKVQEENLVKIGENRFWLKKKIQEQGASDFKNVFFCSIDHNGKVFVNKKT